MWQLQLSTPRQIPQRVSFLLKEAASPWGSSDREAGRDDDEGPQHQVAVASFALARTEVTRGEFAEFVTATGYQTDAERSPTGCAPLLEDDGRTSWNSPGWEQTDAHPVVCVSRNDAYAYAEWKGQQLGISLRIPTEAEYEYALRKPNRTVYPWGIDGDRGCVFGNIGDVNFKNFRPEITSTGNCDDGYTFTAPVGTFRPDGVGTVDLSGNVWEWSADCFVDNYAAAPADGSAMTGATVRWECCVALLLMMDPAISVPPIVYGRHPTGAPGYLAFDWPMICKVCKTRVIDREAGDKNA